MAEKTLVIVESPSKAKTINKYLGSKYKVNASVGHIKDLEKHNLGIDIENNFTPKYVTVRGKAGLVKELKKDAKAAKEVLIATDPDREGEAIAWHIAEELKKENANIKRVLFNEITKVGVKKGLAEPREIDMNLFLSQQARRVLDRIIGFRVSPFLSRAMLSKTSQSLSAGRVQSVALRLICEREEEINNFIPINYWNIYADFSDDQKTVLKTRLVAYDNNTIKTPEGSARDNEDYKKLHYIKTEEQAGELIAKINEEKFEINEIIKKKVKRNPQAPFTTSSLQQEAARRLGFSNKKTMIVAQKLYEGVNIGADGAVGLITYMRTDSVRVSDDAVNAAREHIEANYGKEYVPANPPKYSSKSSNVQDAHEAIRPTTMSYLPSEVHQYLDKEEYRLYQLIYNRFIASQMSQALIDQTTINITGGDFTFRTTGSTIAFKGFLAVYDDISEDKTNGDDEKASAGILPSYLSEGTLLNIDSTEISGKSTKAKPRFTEASLVKELDEKGIGRPSTYAAIVSTLLDREYVDLRNKAFEPTELGVEVNKVLIAHFPQLFQVKFTAEMENDLDVIAEGGTSYEKTVGDFYKPFMIALDKAEQSDAIEKILCEVCGSEMVIKVSRNGRFLGCSKYPECKSTKPLPKGEKEQKAPPQIAEGIICDLCGKPMFIRSSKYGKFYGCTDYPKCKGIKQITVPGIKCPKCLEGSLTERNSPKSRKSFWGCTNFPECDYITNYEPISQECPSCKNKHLEIRFKKNEGEWDKYLTCPKCHEKFDIKIAETK